MEERYARQTMLPEIGEQGQRRLSEASVLIVGIGGLGSAAALYLTGAGVGRIGLADADTVSKSNLQRQVLYTERQIGMPKSAAARERLAARSSPATVCLRSFSTRLFRNACGHCAASFPFHGLKQALDIAGYASSAMFLCSKLSIIDRFCKRKGSFAEKSLHTCLSMSCHSPATVRCVSIFPRNPFRGCFGAYRINGRRNRDLPLK